MGQERRLEHVFLWLLVEVKNIKNIDIEFFCGIDKKNPTSNWQKNWRRYLFFSFFLVS